MYMYIHISCVYPSQHSATLCHTHCNTRCNTHCNGHRNTHCNSSISSSVFQCHFLRYPPITHCNTMQHTATQCNTLQHALQRTLQHTMQHTLQHALQQFDCKFTIPVSFPATSPHHTLPPHCKTLKHTATHTAPVGLQIQHSSVIPCHVPR